MKNKSRIEKKRVYDILDEVWKWFRHSEGSDQRAITYDFKEAVKSAIGKEK